MPVIGRLDEQVDKVLIDPVSRRREPDGPTPETGHAPPDEMTSEAERPGAAGGSEGAKQGELPVWLL